jgi:two-component system, NtrC family, sensor kinase
VTLVQAHAASPRPVASAPADPRGAILVVDDVEANLTAMDALLCDLGEIVLARSGNEALLQLLKREFAVMLLDVQMPAMDGYEVARYARENPDTRGVPIVFLTAGATPLGGTDDNGARVKVSEDSMLRGYGSGAVDFLLKPINPSILRSKVRIFLELHAGRRQVEVSNKALERANGELERAYHDLRAAQAGLIQAAKMASLGELVAGIAHEINNPLAFCVSHLETVKRSLNVVEPSIAEGLAEPSRQHWDRAKSRLHEMTLGLGRINDLVLKLRAFSRLDEGSSRKVDVRECIDSVLTILGHRLAPRIQVTTDLAGPTYLQCHPGLFNQALMNLISNAIDAIEGEGTIGVSTQAADGKYRIVVQDSGSGIDPKLKERVFEPFFTTKPVGQGTGLGLSIAYSIVQKHGGRLEVEDAPGGGTRMIMQVPIDEQRGELT